MSSIAAFDFRTEDDSCSFGPTLSLDPAQFNNDYLRGISDVARFENWTSLVTEFCSSSSTLDTASELYQTLCASLNPEIDPNNPTSTGYDVAPDNHFAPRTCNQFWNPLVTVEETNVDAFYLGMASQSAEREDFIITPDLRGKVFGGLDHTRRDLMAQNLQRGRDHGLPDFNSARIAYGLPPKFSFEDLNPEYGTDEDITNNIERLRDVYRNDISK